VSFAGDPVIEREVTEDVASCGSQIGWLIALTAAAPDAITGNADAKQALDKVTKARVEIDRIKRRRKQSAIDKARDALADLGASDKAGYARLVRSLDPNKPLGSE
jgi:hypothetical protein